MIRFSDLAGFALNEGMVKMSCRVLVIEKDEMLAEAFGHILRELDLDCELSLDMETGIKRIGSTAFDLAVVELDTDDDVEEFLRVKSKIDIPVLISSFEPHIIVRCREAELASDYLLKPFRITTFEEKVNELCLCCP